MLACGWRVGGYVVDSGDRLLEVKCAFLCIVVNWRKCQYLLTEATGIYLSI